MKHFKLIAGIVAENIILVFLVIGSKNMELSQMDLQLIMAKSALAAQGRQTELANRQIGLAASQTRDCMAKLGQAQAFIVQTTQQAEAQPQPSAQAQQTLVVLRLLKAMLL
jgi:hypothetical protein